MHLKDLKYNQAFRFATNEPLTYRGHEQASHEVSGQIFVYETVCEGTAPRLLDTATGVAHIFTSSTYYREIIVS